MPVEGSAPIMSGSSNPNSGKVIIMSHGLGANLNAYSSICCNWASQGFVIISVAHLNDEICVDFRVASKDDPKIIRDFLFEKRNRDLKIRIMEMTDVFLQLKD